MLSLRGSLPDPHAAPCEASLQMSTSPPASLRLFFALWPDDATRAALMQLQASMQGRLVSYDNLHLTLSFLGHQPPDLLPVLQDMLDHLPPPAPTLRLDRIGYFTRKRIAWAGMHQVPEPLLALQEELQRALQRATVRFDDQPRFKPHVTLAREASLPADRSFTPIIWQAHQVALVQSTTHADGPAYQVLAARSLERARWTADESGNLIR